MPAWCEITYSVSVLEPEASKTFSFNGDPLERRFTFNNVDDLSLAGSSFTDYTITVTGTIGNVVTKSESSSFNLRIKNPCIDPNYVTI